MTWKKYRKKTIQLMRDYIPGESLEDISIAIKSVARLPGMNQAINGIYHLNLWRKTMLK